jgi:hypothetical protein
VAEGWEVRGPVRREPMPEVYVAPPSPEAEEAGAPAYELDIPEARNAEEWHSVYRDLEFVIEVSSYLVRLLEQREQQLGQPTSVGSSGAHEQALYTAALVAYMRCFGSGKRKNRLDESIFSGDAAHLLERHRYYKNTRDKHIAHSVNAFETTKSAAWIAGLDTENPEIRQVGVLYTIRTTDAIDAIRWMVKLATYAQTIAFGRMDRANKKLHQRVHALSKEKLKKLKMLKVYPSMGPETAATPRQ